MTQAEWESVRRHIMTGVSSAIAGATAMGFLTGVDATSLTQGVSMISDGAAQIGQGLVLIGGVVMPVYVAWRAKRNASPQAQIAAVAEQPDRIVVKVDPAHSAAATMKVAELAQVQEVVTSNEDAKAIPVTKVVGAEVVRNGDYPI